MSGRTSTERFRVRLTPVPLRRVHVEVGPRLQIVRCAGMREIAVRVRWAVRGLPALDRLPVRHLLLLKVVSEGHAAPRTIAGRGAVAWRAVVATAGLALRAHRDGVESGWRWRWRAR